MTDNEIIKALECRVKDKCPECPYFHGYPCDKCRNMQTDALDLINRLEAEKQSLKYDYDNLQRQFDEIYQQFHYLSNVEIPYLYSFTEDKDKKLETIANILLRTKAEAYKEFAENAVERVEKAKLKYQRLCKEQGEEMEEHMHTHFNGIIGIIKNLLKELMGDAESPSE